MVKEEVILNQMIKLAELVSKYPELKDWITEVSQNIADAKKEADKEAAEMLDYIHKHMEPSDTASVIKYITENSK